MKINEIGKDKKPLQKEHLLKLQQHAWIEATIDELQAGMEQGMLTSEQLVQLYLGRIQTHDQQGVMLHSIVELNPDAVSDAAALDQERKLQGPRGVMHGIPVLLKDNIYTADRTRTSAGSWLLSDFYASKDALLVSKLREAGAVILGKTNMTEWAAFMSRQMPHGFSARGGQTLNPYGPGTIPIGGSSSGSAAAVAANLTSVAIGTETSGSIICPSSFNAIVGIKPTTGLVSCDGLILASLTQDTAGPMARTVRDAAIVLGVMVGGGLADPEWENHDYTQYLNREGLGGFTIGVVMDDYAKLDSSKQQLLNQAVADLRELGALVVEVPSIHSPDLQWTFEVVLQQFKWNMDALLAALPTSYPVHSLKELIAYNEQQADKAMLFGQDVLIDSEKTNLTPEEYLKAMEKDTYLARKIGVDQAMEVHQLDVLLFPETSGYRVAAKSGYPILSVPAGFVANSPMGIHLLGKAYSEPVLLRVAYEFEQATMHRVPPVL
ncbi:amidase [Paenibacillus sp. S3N08]|uniref:Amidase n=2 Tax=Paenibacillus agricola TaxID=2716264 RepID=A0ABX0JEE1_9BACL|nr:amidase [Paenibacillus agricola]